MLTEVAVEYGEDYKEAPDHHYHEDLLLIVKLVSDLARLRLEGSELCALIEPLGDVPNLLTSDKRVKTGLSELTTRRQDPIFRLRFDLK